MYWRLVFAAPVVDFANLGDDRVFIGRLRGRESEGVP